MILLPMRISFGEFLVDTDQRRLFAGDREIRLAPKAFDLLRDLIENRPRALKKDELFKRIWPRTLVTESNLATLIADVRSALGDDAQHPRWIRTVYAYGYAFIGEAEERHGSEERCAQGSGWTLICGEREAVLHDGEHILGRTGSDVIVVDSPSVSRRHARILIAGERVTVEDLGSKNGTWVGQAPATGPTAVKDGDEIRLGSMVTVLRLATRASTTETAEHAG